MCEWYIGSLFGGYSAETREAMSDAQYEKMMQSAKRNAYVFEKAFEANVYPAIGDKRANTVTVEDCTDIHRTIAGRGTPVQVNRVISYLAAAFQYSRAVKGKTSEVPSLIAWYRATPKFGVMLSLPINLDTLIHHMRFLRYT
jgi:hypothetical protein